MKFYITNRDPLPLKPATHEPTLSADYGRCLCDTGRHFVDRHCRPGDPTANNKEYSSLRHYRVIVHYRLLQ